MTRDNETTGDRKGERPFVFHICELRERYGECGLTAREFAALAGIPWQTLETLERRRGLPVFVDALLRVAFALQVRVEELVDDDTLRSLRTPITRRRAAAEGGADDESIGFRCRDHDG